MSSPIVEKLAMMFRPQQLFRHILTPQEQAAPLIAQIESAGLRVIDPSDDSRAPVTEDYRLAIAGEGPQAYQWEDKPHRLVYDLCREVDRLRALLDEKSAP